MIMFNQIEMRIDIFMAISAMFLGSVSTASAQATGWVYVAKTVTGSKWYYNSDTIYRAANETTVWQKIDHSQDRKYKERETLLLTRYDCLAKTSSNITFTNIYPNGINEKYDFSASEQKAAKILPGSILEAVFEKVCHLAMP
jgi:hypothetical protein